jgi:putative transposase
MLTTYRFRLYPNRATEEKLLWILNMCRWTYNKLLELKNTNHLGRLKLQAMLVELKEKNPELKNVNSKVLQMVNSQLAYNLKVLASLKHNGKKVGRLRFKSESRYRTLNFNQSGFRVDCASKKLWLSKIGSITVKLHRPIDGRIKGVFVKRERTGKWFAGFQVEVNSEPLPPSERAVGVDVGLKYFLTDSDGRHIENPRYYRRTLEKIRHLQRQVSRKKKGSANRRKAILKLNRAYEKLTNQRDDFLHKLSTFYVKSYGMIVVEDLRIENMVRNHSYAQSILDAGWGRFFGMLSYKAESAGRMPLKVNPAYTSQLNEDKIEDHDFRGSVNILNRGLSGLGRPLVPVEMRPLLDVPASRIVEAGSPLG